MALKQDDRILLTLFSGVLEMFTGRGDVKDFAIEEDSLRPKLKCVIKDEDGNLITDIDTASFSMRKADTGALVLDEVAMTVDSAPNAEISYDWQAGNTANAGIYMGRVAITRTAESKQPIPDQIINIEIFRKFSSS